MIIGSATSISSSSLSQCRRRIHHSHLLVGRCAGCGSRCVHPSDTTRVADHDRHVRAHRESVSCSRLGVPSSLRGSERCDLSRRNSMHRVVDEVSTPSSPRLTDSGEALSRPAARLSARRELGPAGPSSLLSRPWSRRLRPRRPGPLARQHRSIAPPGSQSITEGLPRSSENVVSEHLARRRPDHGGATCIGRPRPHRRDAHRERRRFSGQTRDGRYSWARYYRPQCSRFISEDPIEFFGGDANLYAYVRGNPIGMKDPLGHFGLGGAIGGAAFNAFLQFGANLALSRGDLSRSFRCINWIDVGISAAYGAVGPTFLGNIVFRNPGPGLTFAENASIYFGLSVPASALSKFLAPSLTIGGRKECDGLSPASLVSKLIGP